MKADPPTSVSLDCLFTGRTVASASSSPRSTSSSPSQSDADSSDGLGLNHIPVFRELSNRPAQDAAASQDELERLRDVEVTVRIELGRARLKIADVLGLEEGSVVQLDRSSEDPVDVYVNDRLVARGEVVVVNDQFAVRLTEVVSPIADE